MKLVTFLGANRDRTKVSYTPTTYSWGEQTFETAFFAQALNDWLKPDRILVCLTKEAKDHPNWTALQQLLPAERLTGVDIPSGRTEGELWEIFQKLTEPFEPGEEVVFDVTFGFRSLPMLVLLVAQYVQAVKNVTLKHLLYGALEAAEDGKTPVFD